MSNSADKSAQAVHSVHRAVSILQVLAREGPAGVTQVAQELGAHKSTVSRLLATLEARGLVEQIAHRGQFQLSYGVVQLAEGATRRHDIAVLSRDTCQELAEAVGETVNIVIRDGSEILSVDQVIGSGTVTTVNWAGQRLPLHATSPGKVFLAAMSEAERASVLSQPLRRYTDMTIVDPAALEEHLQQVRLDGFGYTLEELEPGLASVAAPVRDLRGNVVATVAASGPIFRINIDTLPSIAPAVLAAAATISERNGFPKPA